MPVEISRELLNKRYENEKSEKNLDLHESNLSYLEKCRQAAEYAAKKNKWYIIKCAKRKKPRKIEDIHEELLNLTKDIINGKVQRSRTVR